MILPTSSAPPATLPGLPSEILALIVQHLFSQDAITISAPALETRKEMSQLTGTKSPLAVAQVNKALHAQVLQCMQQNHIKFTCPTLPAIVTSLDRRTKIYPPYFFGHIRELNLPPAGAFEYTVNFQKDGTSPPLEWFPNIEKVIVELKYDIAQTLPTPTPGLADAESEFATAVMRTTMHRDAYMVVRFLEYEYKGWRLEAVVEIVCCVNGVKVRISSSDSRSGSLTITQECVASIKEGRLSIHQVGFAAKEHWEKSIDAAFQLGYIRATLDPSFNCPRDSAHKV
jgi:hypothetical protein